MSDELELTLSLTPTETQTLLVMTVYVDSIIENAEEDVTIGANDEEFVGQLRSIRAKLATEIENAIGANAQPDADGMFDPSELSEEVER